MARRTLNDSFIFSMMVKTPKMGEMISKIDIRRDAVELSVLRDAIDQINRKLKYPTSSKVADLMQQGRIKFVYNPGTVSLPKYLNVVGIRKPGFPKPYFVVDLSSIPCRGNRDEELVVNARTLFCLMQNAAVLEMFNEKWEVVANNDNLRKQGSMAYSKLATKILIKLYAVDNDAMKSDLIRFMFAKFYLLNMSGCQLDQKALHEIAYMSCVGGTSKTEIERLEGELGSDKVKYENINTLFAAFKGVPGLFSLNMRSFTENWVRMYGTGFALAIDYLPSFLGMLFSTVALGGLVKDPIFGSICGSEIIGAYSAFAKMCN